MKKIIFLLIMSLLTTIECVENDAMLRFPGGFKLGVSTSSYQTEGGWNVSDKALSTWDVFTHETPSRVLDNSNGDVASDSYHKYKEDIDLLKELGVDFYRFSISWPRILPTGYPNKVSQEGIKFYNNLIDGLIASGIEPWVTIYHFDHPTVLEDMGGWTNELMVTWFADYARVVFREFGDRVKFFVTINEPTMVCSAGYGVGSSAPGKKDPHHALYHCVHNMLKAHARAYRIYDREFRELQGGKVGIAVVCDWNYPKTENETNSAETRYAYGCGWALDPIYSKAGGYPAVMKSRIGENSKLEGYEKSRLPEFTEKEIEDLRGSSDYLGFNHYSSVVTESAPKSNTTLWYNDSGVILSGNTSWPLSINSRLAVVPEGFGNILRRLKDLYDNPAIYVLENGYPDNGTHDDYQRIQYLHGYLRELLVAVHRDGCNIKGYATWSLLDNFQWEMGYTEYYGLVGVDFRDRQRKRTPKLSFKWYQQLIKSRKIPKIVKPKFVPIHSRAYAFGTNLYLQHLIYFILVLIVY